MGFKFKLPKLKLKLPSILTKAVKKPLSTLKTNFKPLLSLKPKTSLGALKKTLKSVNAAPKALVTATRRDLKKNVRGITRIPKDIKKEGTKLVNNVKRLPSSIKKGSVKIFTGLGSGIKGLAGGLFTGLGFDGSTMKYLKWGAVGLGGMWAFSKLKE